MDGLLRRTRMAERQVSRRLKAKALSRHRNVFKPDRRMQIREVVQSLAAIRKESIESRREEWELGPLTPKRDVPRLKDWEADRPWGAIPIDIAKQQIPMTSVQVEARCKWAGGSMFLCLSKDDRVVVLEGVHKGRIGKIASIAKEIGAVELDIAKSNMMIPKPVQRRGQPIVTAVADVVPISAIRLVHPIEQHGLFKDVIIREIRPIDIVRDRPTRTVQYQRYVPGLNAIIPWPHAEELEHEEYDVDTTRLVVEERTYVPSLLRPPMPEVVIDELRNRYSKFRTRHTDEYVAAKEAELAAKEARRKSGSSMRTALQEFHIKQRAERRARGQPVLTDDMLVRVGEVMFENRHRRDVRLEEKNQAVWTRAVRALALDRLAAKSTGAETATRVPEKSAATATEAVVPMQEMPTKPVSESQLPLS